MHRLLHWKPLYKHVHYLHHKNVNPNPWSGMAMHPVEIVIYLSVAGLLLYGAPGGIGGVELPAVVRALEIGDYGTSSLHDLTFDLNMRTLRFAGPAAQSVLVSPCPGKCLPHAATPSACSVRTMAAPSCFVTTFRRNLENELPADTEQCPQRALALGLDHSDFIAAMAPKPVVLLGNKKDLGHLRQVSFCLKDALDKTKIRLALKINQSDLTRIISTLERFEYRIVARYDDSRSSEPDRDRFDLLMRYLNI